MFSGSLFLIVFFKNLNSCKANKHINSWKIGAKWTNKHIAPDDRKIEMVEPADYDAKRDCWNGYDASAYACNTQRKHGCDFLEYVNTYVVYVIGNQIRSHNMFFVLLC